MVLGGDGVASAAPPVTPVHSFKLPPSKSAVHRTSDPTSTLGPQPAAAINSQQAPIVHGRARGRPIRKGYRNAADRANPNSGAARALSLIHISEPTRQAETSY